MSPQISSMMVRRLVPLVTSMALAISGGVLATAASAAPAADQVSPGQGGSGALYVGPTTTTAQPFVAQSTGSLTSVVVTLEPRQWIAHTNLTVAIYGTTNGVLQSSPLGSVALGQTYLETTLENGTADVTATFATAIPVTAGTTYALVLSTTDNWDRPDIGWAYKWKAGNYCAPFYYSKDSTDPGANWVQGQGAVQFTTYVDGVAASVNAYPAPFVMALPGHERATVNVAQCSGDGTWAWASVYPQWTSVEYRVGSGSWTTAPIAHSSESFDVTGLTDGTPVTISVRVTTDANGTSAVSSATVTPTAQRPAAPTNLTVLVPGDGKALIDFDAGSDNGSPITRYEYQLDFAGAWTPVADGKTESPVTVSGLTNGTATWVNLRAVNAQGAGPAAPYAVRTIAGAPEAPTALVVTPGNNSVSVSFTPCLPGVSPITGYQYFSSGVGEFINPAAPTSTSPVVITGLTNGNPFNVQIRAGNALSNEGVASEVVTAVVGAGQPVVSGTQTTCASSGPVTPPTDDGGATETVDTPSVAPTQTPAPAPASAPSSNPVSNAVLQTTPEFVPPKTNTTVAGGLVVVSTAAANKASVDKLPSAPSTTFATAPLLVAQVGDPIKLEPTGFTPGVSYKITMTVGSKVVVLGTVTADANGKLRLPVVMATRLGSSTIAIAPPTGKPAYIKVKYRSA